jgi:hypothetical protein
MLASAASFLSGAQAQTADFADPAFEALWLRTDALVASGDVKRPWVWGPAPGETMSEPFGGLPGNAHLVQFFDKGRMELNDPSVDPNDPFYVTNGRLAVELISGQVQTGLTTFQDLGTAQINLASDSDDPSAPTYGSFNGVASIPGAPNDRRAPDRKGTIVRTAIDRQGNTQPWPENHLDYGVSIVHYEEATGHNIPGIFWDYLNQQATIVQDGQVVQGPLFYPWFAVTGYPISEPYWSYVKVEGKYTDVLIQAYERRVLTFVPHLPSPFKVQMGNIGQHYFEWRYSKSQPGTPRPPVATPTRAGLPPKANVTIDGIEYRQAVFDLNGTFCIITNRGENAISLAGWRLDSPKWGIVDTFRFPDNVTIAAGASIRVRSGVGRNTATDVYMFRPTVMWDGQNYDYAVLYDNYARQVADFFPAGDVGPPPTAPPVATNTLAPGQPTNTAVPGAPTSTPQGPPPPKETGQVPVPTSTNTRVAATPSRTASGGTPTVTATPGGGTGCTELIRNGDFEQQEENWNIMGEQLVTGHRPHAGTYGAFLGDLDDVDDKLWQVVSIPATSTRVDFSYWRRMETADTSGQERDRMFTQVRSQDGNTIRTTLETITNLSTPNTWDRVTFSLLAYKGETVSIFFNARTDVTISTDFFFDDLTLQACQ